MKAWKIGAAAAAFLIAACAGAAAVPNASSSTNAVRASGKKKPHAVNLVVVIMENRDYDLIIGSSSAPYINGTLVPQAALMTDSHAVGHPSEPNYVAFFSGSTQGLHDDSCPHTFTAYNAGQELIAAGKTFDGYSESMPYNGYTGCTSGEFLHGLGQ